VSDQARRTWEAYARAIGVDPVGLASWDVMGAKEQDAWRAAVVAAVDTEPKPETLTDKQVRLLDEMGTAKLGKLLKAHMPSNRGFILFTIDYGPRGNLAYIATVARDDAIRTLREWLRKMGAL